jgi:hypothetical protein
MHYCPVTVNIDAMIAVLVSDIGNRPYCSVRVSNITLIGVYFLQVKNKP